MACAYKVILSGDGVDISYRKWICFEDIWRELHNLDLGNLSLYDVDNSCDEITITGVKAKKLRRSKALIADIARRHYFLGDNFKLVDLDKSEAME